MTGLFAFLSLSRTGAAQKVFKNCPLVEKPRLFLPRCEGEDRGKIAAQHDHQFRAIGHEIDAADQRAELVGRQCPRLLVAKLVVKSSDLLVIILRQIGMQKGRWFFRTVEKVGQLFLAGFEPGTALFDHIHRQRIVEIEIKDLLKLPVNAFRLSLRGVDGNTSFHPCLVYFSREFLAEFLVEVRLHQMFVEPVQNGLFERVAADIEPVVASPFCPGVGAAEHVLRNHRVTATAAAALDEAGEQMLWPSALIQNTVVASLGSGLQRHLVLPRLYRIPQVLIDDAQIRHVLNYPIRFRIGTGNTLARIWVRQVTQAVPDQFPDIEFIVENAGPALGIAVDGRRPPFTALRTWHAFAVQHHGDRARRLARQIFRKNAPDDIGFPLVDGALAAVRLT